MDNHSYNLLKSLTKKAQAVSKYDIYLKDAGNCQTCKNLWERLKKEDEEDMKAIKKVLEEHAKEGKL